MTRSFVRLQTLKRALVPSLTATAQWRVSAKKSEETAAACVVKNPSSCLYVCREGWVSARTTSAVPRLRMPTEHPSGPWNVSSGDQTQALTVLSQVLSEATS